MKRYFILGILWLATFFAQAQVPAWKEIAEQQGNTPELVKAVFARLNFEMEVNQDALPDEMQQLEKFIEADKNSEEQAVLYSYLAKIYAQYYQANACIINQRTEIPGDAPQDIREWTKNLFVQKIDELETKTGTSNLFIRLDFLDIRRLQLGTMPYKEYFEALLALEKQYANQDICVEILDREVSCYRQNNQIRQACELCLQGIKKYPNYERIGLLKNQLGEITQPHLSVTTDNVVYPQQDLNFHLNYKNLDKITLSIYKISAPVSVYSNNWSRNGQYKTAGTLVKTQEITFEQALPYLEFDTIIPLQISDLGNYEYVITADSLSEPANGQFSVSRLATVSRSVDDRREYLVVDRMSGKPVEGAKINFYQREKYGDDLKKAQSSVTNHFGLATGGDGKNTIFYNVSSGNDTALILSSTPWTSTFHTSDNATVHLNLFTDRSIYRPGQTVHFKGIATEISKKMQRVVSNKTYTLTFNDTQYQKIDTLVVTTNEFGSFSGQFVIPQGQKTGRFSINSDADNGYASVQVEEYKRPTVDIQFETQRDTLWMGDTVTVRGTAKTFSGVPLQNTAVQYNITRSLGWLMRTSSSEPVTQGTTQTQSDGSFAIQFKAVKSENSGRMLSSHFTVETTITDARGETQQEETRVLVRDTADQLPPRVEKPENFSIKTLKDTCAVGEKAQLVFSSLKKDVSVLYEVFKDNKRIFVSRFVVNKQDKKIEIPFLETYGDGITATFTLIKDGEFFTQTVSIYKKQPDKRLNIKLETFRDRLLPGQQEEWKIAIRDAKNQPVVSELLATMYDASLDAMTPLTWNFSPLRSINLWTIYNQKGNEFNSDQIWEDGLLQPINVPATALPDLDDLDFYVERRGGGVLLRGGMMMKSVVMNDAVPPPPMLRESALQEDADYNGMTESVSVDLKKIEEPVKIRQNFAETAFFYPQLTTNESGETTFSFTVPESNTTWQFKGLAHTQDLYFGQIAQTIISQKQLMVSPNIPRFLRTGDTATLSSSISNLSDSTISGNIRLESPIADSTQSFTVEAGKTISVNWTLNVPDVETWRATSVPMKIVAQSEKFSDGEQHLIPVLSNQLLVNEALPFTVTGGETRTFPFAAQGDSLTLECSNNPTWYAVQALPEITTPKSDNAVDWFAAYYANQMTAQIVNQYPQIQSTLTIIPNPLSLDKLRELQSEEGGWAWFKGMNSDVGITQWILYGMAGLGETNDMIPNAIKFIDQKFKKHYKSSLRASRSNPTATNSGLLHSVRNDVTTYDLEYLFVRSLYPTIPTDTVANAIKFYTDAAEKNWNNKHTSLYDKALIAMILQRAGKTKTAKEIIQWLRTRATNKPDLGMYWANNNTNCFMTQSAVCVHTFIMQAFQEIGTTTAESDAMKLWLLQQKHTQEWENVPATVNAINILLKTGSNWLDDKGQTNIKLGDTLVYPVGRDVARHVSSSTGTGYFKTTLENSANAKTITVTKSGTSPAWGALYWRYWGKIDHIQSAKTVLNVEKSLITPHQPLQVGDKVTVRLTVRSDRDMEYVQIKDLRASCLEPARSLSGMQYKQGVAYYVAPTDEAMDFYFPSLPKGTYVFEYELFVTSPGDYSNGISTIQCLYAPEFVSHTEGGRVVVK
ncbi:hypothetical protein FACS1894176_08380 [Bacteroidia bacterium]|nr:hypothetical protein FACS1894176_08380 [Bacteroidia bacterium]